MGTQKILISKIGPAHATEIEISKKYCMSFPENVPRFTPRKSEISENFLDDFPRFANEG